MAQVEVQEYDLALYNIIAAGRILTGYGTGGKATLSYNNDRLTPVEGVDGNVVYSKSAIRSGGLSVTLLSTSSSLPYLRKLAAAGKPFPLSVMDANDSSKISATHDKCVIKKVPDVPASKDPGDVTVDFYIPDVQIR